MAKIKGERGVWEDLFPKGRDIFYEGNDPRGFRAEMRAKFGFDPITSPPKGYWHRLTWQKERCFNCPANVLDTIYGNTKYPLGS